jgi:hypothetical protein
MMIIILIKLLILWKLRLVKNNLDDKIFDKTIDFMKVMKSTNLIKYLWKVMKNYKSYDLQNIYEKL